MKDFHHGCKYSTGEDLTLLGARDAIATASLREWTMCAASLATCGSGINTQLWRCEFYVACDKSAIYRLHMLNQVTTENTKTDHIIHYALK